MLGQKTFAILGGVATIASVLGFTLSLGNTQLCLAWLAAILISIATFIKAYKGE